MNKRKFFLLPICLLLLGACNLNQPSSQAKASEPEASSPTEESSAPHEHQFGEWVETTAPTCTEKAVETRTCSCGATETRDGRDALGHDFGGEDAWTITTRPTCTEKGQESRKCSRCDATEKRDADALGHKWDDGVVTTAPTAENKGVKTFTCTRSGCNATRTEDIDKVQGVRVTFVHSAEDHFKVFVYKTKSYDTETPTETYSCYARDENGNAIDYDASASLQPQVNFKVVCDDNYVVKKANVVVAATDPTDTGDTHKNIKQGPDTGEGLPDATYFRITKIQRDITITITAVEDSGQAQNPGYVTEFVTNHCQVKVYVGPKDATGSNVDEGPNYYTRSKDSPYGYSLNNGQINFEVIPDAGYKFVSGLEISAEGKVPFVACADYNKVVRESENWFRVTKINADIAISLKCIPEGGEDGLGYVVTFVTDEHCHVLVFEDGTDYRFTPTAPVDNKTLSRTKTGDAAKYVAKDEANGIAEVKPQVSFRVICDDGYEVVADNVVVAGTFKNKKVGPDTGENLPDATYYKITVIKSDLTITITSTAKAAA